MYTAGLFDPPCTREAEERSMHLDAIGVGIGVDPVFFFDPDTDTDPDPDEGWGKFSVGKVLNRT